MAFVFRSPRITNLSQIESNADTLPKEQNNSSVINYENENKFKSNTKDFSFNNNTSSQTPINVHKNENKNNMTNLSNLKEKINYITINDTSSSYKVCDILNKLKNNYTIKYNYYFGNSKLNNSNLNSNSNKSNIINNSLKNINFSLFNSNSLLWENKNNSNINLSKNNNKKFPYNKVKIKEDYKKRIYEKNKIKKFPENIDCCSSYSYLTNNSSLAYKTLIIERTIATPISNPKINETKITSSKIKYRQNKFVSKFDIGYTKLTKSYSKNANILNYMNYHSNVRIALFVTNNITSDILKINKNNHNNYRNYPKLYNKKINSSVIISTINKINNKKN